MFRKLYNCAVPVQPDDLTARARIREAALELFARNGVAGTSMRSIAAKAGVSPSLVVHHFGTKTGLRDAVDDAVRDGFAGALAGIDLTGSVDAVSERINAGIAGIMGGDDPNVREYIGRSLFEADGASHRLFDDLVEIIDAGFAELERARLVRADTDRTWRTYAVLFVVLGPVFLSRQIETRLGLDAFAPDVVAARSACNVDLMRRGFFTG
jgi:TetR/AcrR family transcriptional regulator, regulator of cefoperazone and chloramphenicol sensitivity